MAADEQLKQLRLKIGESEIVFVMDDAGGRDHVLNQALVSGLVYYELPLPTVLGALSQESVGDFIDVGANTGLYSLLSASANKHVYCHAFEPIDHIGKQLEHNIKINNKLSSRIAYEPIALSDRTGSVTMYEHINPIGLIATSSSLQSSIPPGGDYRLTTITASKFDAWIASRLGIKVDFIKVDVEGHEHAFLQGAVETIRDHRPIIVMEMLAEANFQIIANIIDELNYHDICLFPEYAKLLEKPAFFGNGWNHLLCPKERAWSFARTCRRIGLPIQ